MNWLVLRPGGERATLAGVDKRALINSLRLDIPIRDTRLLDPSMQVGESTNQLLIRDKAIVLSMARRLAAAAC